MALFGDRIPITIDAPVETVFAYVSDYHKTTRYMKGVLSWEPVDQWRGVGTLMRGKVRVGPKIFISEAEVTAWEENRLIVWESRSGITNNGRWTFKPDGERTKVTLEQKVEPRSRAIVELLAKPLEPFLKAQGRRSLEALKKQVETQVTQKGR
jgi:uncharacterized membrane protein